MEILTEMKEKIPELEERTKGDFFRDACIHGYFNLVDFLRETYVEGVLPHEKQNKGRLSPKVKTTLNALIFGLGGSALEYSMAEWLGNEHSSFISDNIAKVLHTPSSMAFYVYLGFNTVQSIYRIAKSQMTNKGVRAQGPIPWAIRSGYAAANYVNERIKEPGSLRSYRGSNEREN